MNDRKITPFVSEFLKHEESNSVILSTYGRISLQEDSIGGAIGGAIPAGSVSFRPVKSDF